MINRRQIIQTFFSTIALVNLPSYTAANTFVRRYQLIASKSKHSFGKNINSTNMWLYNQICPGPLLTARKGEILEIIFTNHLDEPTTIHWHGIRILNKMDGVPDLTQSPIETGKSFTYRFPVNDAGTFWYHSHNRAWEQIARGLYGLLVVTENDYELNSNDILIVVDDWRINKTNQIEEESFGNLHDWSHSGRLGNYLTINGQSIPDISIPTSGPLRLRFINTANARIVNLQFKNKLPFKVICLDGAPCKPFVLDTLVLSPAQRADIIIENCSELESLYEVSAENLFKVSRFKHKINSSFNSLSTISLSQWYKTPPLEKARIVNIRMQGGAMGNLSSAIFEGQERSLHDLATNERKLWAFNGKVGGYELNLADVSLGDIVVLRVWNDTNWKHAMHLHGHHFWVNSREFGKKTNQVLRDTYLMQPQEKTDLLFVADNPGKWLFHCHMLEHNASGLGGVISIS